MFPSTSLPLRSGQRYDSTQQLTTPSSGYSTMPTASHLPRSPSPDPNCITSLSPTFTSELNRTRPRAAVQHQQTPSKSTRVRGGARTVRDDDDSSDSESETLESSTDEGGVEGSPIDRRKRPRDEKERGTRKRIPIETDQEPRSGLTRQKRSHSTSAPPQVQATLSSRPTSVSSSDTSPSASELRFTALASSPHSSLSSSDIDDLTSDESDDGSVSFDLVPPSLRPSTSPNPSAKGTSIAISTPSDSDDSSKPDTSDVPRNSERGDKSETICVVEDEEMKKETEKETEREKGKDALDSPVDLEASLYFDNSTTCDTLKSGLEATQSASILPIPDQDTSSTTTPSKNDSFTSTTQPQCTPQQIEAKRQASLARRDRKAQERRERDQQRLGASKLAEYEAKAHQDSSTKESSEESTLSEEQKEILELVRQGKNVFITGSAGVGKSFTLAQVTDLLESLRRRYNVTAPTGIAAINVGGNTIHSWAGIGLAKESISQLYNLISSRSIVKENWTKSHVLIIDEISMVHPLLFTKLNILGQLLRQDPRPFGGLQLIVCGDFFQLPPVDIEVPHEMTCVKCGKLLLRDFDSSQPVTAGKGSEQTQKYRCSQFLDEKGQRRKGCGICYEIPTFAFETAAWQLCDFKIVELTKVFRQSHREFVAILEKIRRGIRDPACLPFFRQCGKALQSGEMKIKPTVLYPSRREVDTENIQAFDKLSGEVYSYKSRDEATGDYAQENMESRLKDSPLPELFQAKKGAQVMLLVNLDPKLGLVNGTRGVVVDFEPAPSDYDLRWNVKDSKNGNEDQIGSEKWKAEASVKFLRQQKHRLVPVVHFGVGKEGLRKTILPSSNTIKLGEKLGTISRTQLPLQLAWALTIHKSQGRSLDAVATNLQKTFANGQAYVALSRARTPEGMRVDGFSLDKIRASPKVKRFYEAISTKVPFLITSIAPSNPLDYLLFDHRRLLNLEETFAPKAPPFDLYDDFLAEYPIENASSPVAPASEPSKPSKPSVNSFANPISISTTSTLSFSIDGIESSDPQDILLALAKQYVANQQASGVLGGFVSVDEEGFVEAARTAVILAKAQSMEQQAGTSTTTSTKRTGQESGLVDEGEGQAQKRLRRDDDSSSADATPTTRLKEMQDELRRVQSLSFETGYGGKSYRRGDAEGWDSEMDDGEHAELGLGWDSNEDSEQEMWDGEEVETEVASEGGEDKLDSKDNTVELSV